MQNLFNDIEQDLLLQSIELDKLELVNQYLLQQIIADHKILSLEDIELHRLERNTRINVSRYQPNE